MFIKKELEDNLKIIAQKYAKGKNIIWNKENNLVTRDGAFGLCGKYLVFDTNDMMGSNYFVIIDKKTLHPLEIKTFGNHANHSNPKN